VWLPRLLYRTLRRLARDEELWNGNRESWRPAFTGREGLVPFAFRAQFDTRRRYPARYAGYPLVRLRSTGEVRAFLAAAEAAEASRRATIAR